MKLYLVQHGEALTKDIDPDRPLSNVGHGEVGQLAELLAGHINISRVIHSGKTRAAQTAEIFTAIIAGEFPIEAVSGIGPNDSVEQFIKQLMEWDEDILVVSHLPFLAKLVNLLVSGSVDRGVASFLPGSIVFLESVNGEPFKVQWMVRPELLNNS